MITRRNVTKGAAWAVPAITVAAAAPSLAASGTVHYTVAGSGDKCPGASNVPGGYPKHGYRIVLEVSPTPKSVSVTSVLLGNGKTADVLTDPVFNGVGWEFIIDAQSSPSKVTIMVLVDGVDYVVDVKTHPHCGK